MSELGLFINPKDGGKSIELTKDNYPLTFIAKVTIHPRNPQRYENKKSVNVPGLSKYNVVIVPSALCHFWAYGSIQMIRINRYWTDGDTFRCEYDYFSDDPGYLPGSDGYSHFFLYGTLKDNPPDTYGLFLNAGASSAIDNFRSITQENEVAYCVYRKKIYIDVSNNRGYWSLPNDIPNRSSALVFLRQESTGQVLRYDRPNNRIISWGAGWVYIVVFSYGLNLQPADGLTIWNKQGKVVFTSDYIPFFNNGQTIKTSGNVATSSFVKPMFTMDVPNTWLENERVNVNCYLSGFRVDGNKLIATRMWTSDFYPGYANREFNQVVYASSYCIDFNDYF
ncbi:DUF6453 family protein [Providencia rettgeri]|uniref:DUF6453 family protein n=1 Tax=Providencia rettgeri TaxID=587 RepID=UPI001B3879C0|nr:DUF6453 family protein [Providencia rettgeri]MBQ0366156.1 hypothetical protein [Providencia rettgeri]